MKTEIVYKLTDMSLYTMNDTQWEPGVTLTRPGGGPLCTGRWLHAYRSPELAAFMNPVHANIGDPVLWACRGAVGLDDGVKLGCTSLRPIGTVALPDPTTTQRVAFGILCAKASYSDPAWTAWTAWADGWLSGADRSASAAASAHAAASYAGVVASYAAAAASYAASSAAAASYAASAHAAHAASYAAAVAAAKVLSCANKAMEIS